MSTLLDEVRREIDDVHAFFTAWFNGTADRASLESKLLSRFDERVVFIPPSGQIMGAQDLTQMFERGYGANRDFRIEISDVAVRRQFGGTALVNYTEWQFGTGPSHDQTNARITSALIEMGPPLRWLHIHETSLPEAIHPTR